MTWVLQAPHQLLVELQVCILLPEAQSMDGMVGGINSSSITGNRESPLQMQCWKVKGMAPFTKPTGGTMTVPHIPICPFP